MPFINLDSDRVSYNKDSFDYVIIGAGAAGILLAVMLTKKKKKVLILESGHFEEDEQRQILNEVEQTGKELKNAVWGRKRAIGGTTIAWGGQSLPFSSLDFEKRGWVEGSGWPITKDVLSPYYQAANRFMGVDEYDYETDIFRLLKMKKLPFNEQQLSYHFAKWAPEPNFRKLFDKQLREDITVVYNAVVTRINIETNGKVDTIDVKNFNQEGLTISVQQLLIATGTLEANRLLLASKNQVEAGLGNHSGWLGKGFMDHPCIDVGFINTTNRYNLQSYFNTHIYHKRKYSLRMSLSEAAQRKFELLNASAGIMFDYSPGQIDPYLEIRRYLKTKKITSLMNLLKNTRAYSLSAWAFLLNNLIYKHNAQARLVMMLEQEPLKSSDIKLSEKKDAFGVPKMIVNWAIGYNTWNTLNITTGYIKSELNRMSMGELIVHPHITPDNKDWLTCLSDVNHHMGGTKMSDVSSGGVVNSNLQVWGHDNLYVCSCSVFPTVSHSNPTLTMMALCLRLVDNLK